MAMRLQGLLCLKGFGAILLTNMRYKKKVPGAATARDVCHGALPATAEVSIQPSARRCKCNPAGLMY